MKSGAKQATGCASALRKIDEIDGGYLKQHGEEFIASIILGDRFAASSRVCSTSTRPNFI